jgi:hypothetical protein
MPTPLELFEQYDQSSTPSIPSIEESNNVLTPLSLFESYEKGITPKGVTPSLAPVGPIVDPNSTSNKWDIATDQAGEMIYDGLALFADKFGADEQAAEWRTISDKYKESALSRPQPEISMSITEEAPKIIDKFSEGEILEAIADAGDFVHSVLIGVAPSMIATGAAVGTAAVAKPVLAGIGAGKLVTGLTTAIIGMTPATLMSSGQVYEEALKYGASEEAAQNIGIGAGSVVGALDRFFFSSFLGGIARKLGPETTIESVKKLTNLSDSMVREAVNKSLSTGGKGLLIEGTTEALQTVTEEVAPALVSEKEIELADLTKKTIDSFAAGGIGGGFVGSITGAVSVPVARNAIRQAEALDADLESVLGTQESFDLVDGEVRTPTYDSDVERKKAERKRRKRSEKVKEDKEGQLVIPEDIMDTTPEAEVDAEARLEEEQRKREIDKQLEIFDQEINLGDRPVGLTEGSEQASGVNLDADVVEQKFNRHQELTEKQRNAGQPIPDEKVRSLQNRSEKNKIDIANLRSRNKKSIFTLKNSAKKLALKKVKKIKEFVSDATVPIQNWVANADATSEQIQELENLKQIDRDITLLKELEVDQKNVGKTLKNANKDAVEVGAALTPEEKAELRELQNDMARNDSGRAAGFFRDLVSRSTTKLSQLANTVPIAGQLVNDLRNIVFNDNAAIGTLWKRKEFINDKIRKAFKLPFQSSIPMKIKIQVAEQLRGVKEATDPRAREVANEIKKEIFDRLYVIARASGIDMGRVENYLPTIYKFRMRGLGRKKDIKKFEEILKANPETAQKVDEIVHNILVNDGVYIPEQDLDIFAADAYEATLATTRRGFELPRSIPKEVVEQLAKAGLVENDFDKIANKYIVDMVRRANLNRFVNKYRPVVNELYRSGLMTKAEGKRIKDIVDALQSKYKNIDNVGLRSLYRFVNSLTYILTLPLAGITALTEPLIVLHKVSPNHAIYGLMDASIVGLRKGIRTFLPRFTRSEKEQSLMSLMQTADLALVDAQRDIGDISISKTVTDKFFRLNLLAQVTQFSRYIAYHAGKRQMAADIELLQAEQLKGTKPTFKSRQARKRLQIEGLGNIIPKIDAQTDRVQPATSEQLEVLTWFSEGMNDATTPAIVTKALGKLVDEVIMTPNVVNKPLWMANPYLSPVAQLKGFMMVFGNTVGMRMYKDVFQPLYGFIPGTKEKGRLPAGEIAKYAMTFTLLASAIMGTQVIKNTIRYGDEESPWDRYTGFEKLWAAILQSNIFGFGNVFVDALRAQKYGLDPISVLLGPAAAKSSSLVKALGSGSPQRIATALANFTPGIASLPADSKRFFTEPVKEAIEGVID